MCPPLVLPLWAANCCARRFPPGRDRSRPIWVPARQQRRRRICPCTAKRTHKPIYFPLVKIHKGGYNESGAVFSCVGGMLSCIGPWGVSTTSRPAFYCLTVLLYIPALTISRAFCQNVALAVDTGRNKWHGLKMIQKFLHSAKGGHVAALPLILFAFYDSKPAERLADSVCLFRGKLCGIGPWAPFGPLFWTFASPQRSFVQEIARLLTCRP